jgi:hypothetical protein
LKENVARTYRKCPLAMARNKRCSKSQRIEMTAMIRRKHKRPVRRQLLATDDCEPMRDREITS